MPEPAPRPRDTSVTHEVAATLRGLMTRGELRPGMRLPSERALAARLSVSRVTVVRALARLDYSGRRVDFLDRDNAIQGPLNSIPDAAYSALRDFLSA